MLKYFLENGDFKKKIHEDATKLAYLMSDGKTSLDFALFVLEGFPNIIPTMHTKPSFNRNTSKSCETYKGYNFKYYYRSQNK
ncbi:MAG: hypothetical protein AB7V77_04210 [Candidatus Woesearchaeota archaeon]